MGKLKKHKTQNFIKITQQEFQRYSNAAITVDEAKEIQNNLIGAVDLLLQWSDKARKKRGDNVSNEKKN